MIRPRLSVDIHDLTTLATAVNVNHRNAMRAIALLRHGHPKAASYSASTNVASITPTNGHDPEAQTPPPAYSDRTGETAYTVDRGKEAGRRYRTLQNRAISALVDFEKFQMDLVTAAPADDTLPRSDEMWCSNHLKYNRFEPRTPGRDGLCGWCWGVRQDPAYGMVPTQEAIELHTVLKRIPRDRLDAAMKPIPNTPKRIKKRRRSRP